MWGTVCWVGFGGLSVTGSLCQLATALMNLRDGARHIAYMRKKTCCTFPETFLSVCHTYMRSLPLGVPHIHQNTSCRYAPQVRKRFLSVCPTYTWALSVCPTYTRTLSRYAQHTPEHCRYAPQARERFLSVCPTYTRTLSVGMPHIHQTTGYRYAPQVRKRFLSVCPTYTRTLPVDMPHRHTNAFSNMFPHTWKQNN